MSRFLGLDWDQHQLHILQGSIGRGGLRLEHAALSLDANSMTPAQAETLGKQLRQRLKDDGFEGAPVLATIGRDRVVVKVVRIPKVPDNEEPALVRFQAAKELAEADNVVIDYFTQDDGPNGRKACVVALRKDTVAFFQAMCKAANLKLLTLTPRAFGIAAAVQHGPVKPGADTSVAVVTLGGQWAEFLIMRGGQVVYQRALPMGPDLVGTIRRNLAAFANHGPELGAPAKVQGLYLAGGEEHPEIRASLEQSLGMPVYALDPFAGQEQMKFPGGPRGGFTALAGMLHLWQAHNAAPINFTKPREPKPTADPNRRQKLVLAALAVAALVALIIAGNAWLGAMADEEQQLRERAAQVDQQLRALAPEAKQIEALKAWQNTTVSWTDELYELTQQFPWKKDVYLKEFNGSLKEQRVANAKGNPAPKGKDTNKENYFASLVIQGQVPAASERLVDSLRDAINGNYPKIRAYISKLPAGEKKESKPFALEIDVARSPNSNYPLKLSLPAYPTRVAPTPIPPNVPAPESEAKLTRQPAGKGDDQ